MTIFMLAHEDSHQTESGVQSDDYLHEQACQWGWAEKAGLFL